MTLGFQKQNKNRDARNAVRITAGLADRAVFMEVGKAIRWQGNLPRVVGAVHLILGCVKDGLTISGPLHDHLVADEIETRGGISGSGMGWEGSIYVWRIGPN